MTCAAQAHADRIQPVPRGGGFCLRLSGVPHHAVRPGAGTVPADLQLLRIRPPDALRPAGRRVEPQRRHGGGRMPACGGGVPPGSARAGRGGDRRGGQRFVPRGRRAGRAQRQPGEVGGAGHFRLPRGPRPVSGADFGPGRRRDRRAAGDFAAGGGNGHSAVRRKDLRRPCVPERPGGAFPARRRKERGGVPHRGGHPAVLHGLQPDPAVEGNGTLGAGRGAGAGAGQGVRRISV